jgi:hypothetical protein
MLDVRTAATTIENLLRDSILYALGQRLPSVPDVAALRAVPTMGTSGTTMRHNDDLIVIDPGAGVVVGYRWSSESAAADDGAQTIKPIDVTDNGRWVRWVSKIYFSPVVGGNSMTLDQITSGPLARVVLADPTQTDEELRNLVFGQVPSVLIVPDGDEPSDLTVGNRWAPSYSFEIMIITENLRDRREASLGSAVINDQPMGGNAIDGQIKALLGYAGISAAEDGLIEIRLGSGRITVSEFGQRLVVRRRTIEVIVTEELANAPNEVIPANEIDASPHLAALAVQPPATTTLDEDPPIADPSNYLVAGMLVAYPMAGLAQPITAGSAIIAGAIVIYAGQSVTFAASSDTYRDLKPDGTMVLTTVAVDGPPPPVLAGALRIGGTRTSATGVLADVILAQTFAPPDTTVIITP